MEDRLYWLQHWKCSRWLNLLHLHRGTCVASSTLWGTRLGSYRLAGSEPCQIRWLIQLWSIRSCSHWRPHCTKGQGWGAQSVLEGCWLSDVLHGLWRVLQSSAAPSYSLLVQISSLCGLTHLCWLHCRLRRGPHRGFYRVGVTVKSAQNLSSHLALRTQRCVL